MLQRTFIASAVPRPVSMPVVPSIAASGQTDRLMRSLQLLSGCSRMSWQSARRSHEQTSVLKSIAFEHVVRLQMSAVSERLQMTKEDVPVVSSRRCDSHHQASHEKWLTKGHAMEKERLSYKIHAGTQQRQRYRQASMIGSGQSSGCARAVQDTLGCRQLCKASFIPPRLSAFVPAHTKIERSAIGLPRRRGTGGVLRDIADHLR